VREVCRSEFKPIILIPVGRVGRYEVYRNCNGTRLMVAEGNSIVLELSLMEALNLYLLLKNLLREA